MEFAYKIPLIFLGAAPIIVWVLFLLYSGKDKKIKKFAIGDVAKKIKPEINWTIRIWKIVFFTLGVVFLILTIARPKGGIIFQNIQNQGRDLVVLLDLSKSMLAEDVQPNRIERAKKDIMDLVDALQGDRIALVVFAGRVEMRCPLTLDYNFFKWALDECQPGVVALGGTAIGDAIREAIKILEFDTDDATDSEWFQDEEDIVTKNKAIILITDGEDHETAPLEAAAQARKNNITIFTVGFGDDGEGSRIPVTNKNGIKEYLKNSQGQIVWSKLNEKLLMDIALQTKNGTYFPAKTRNINMRNVYENYIAQLEVELRESAKKPRKKEQYQLFLLLACICFVIESYLMEGTTRTKNIIVLMVFGIFMISCSDDKDIVAIHNQGNRLYEEQKFIEAKEKYQEAELALPGNGIIHYNMGNTFYQSKDWENARKHYQNAASSDLAYLKTQRLFATAFNEGCLYYREAEVEMGKQGSQDQVTNVIQLLQKSLEHFRVALTYNPGNKETLYNLKFVKLKLKSFLDMLHKKQQEQQEKQQNSIYLLAQIRKMQIFLLRQTNMFVDNELHEKLPELTETQKEISKTIEKLSVRLEEDFAQVKQQVNQGNQGQLNPQAASQIQQMEQMLVFAKESIRQAQELSQSAEQKLKEKEPGFEEQEQSFNVLEMLWQLLATPDFIIQEDILLQAFVVNDLNLITGENEKLWSDNGKHQDMAIAATELFIQKFAIMEQAMANLPAQNQPQNGNDPQQQPQIDKEKIKALSQQALDEQQNSIKFIQEKKQSESSEWATKALETLQKIAQEMGQQNNNSPQNQDKEEEDKNKEEKEQQQQNQNQNKDKQQQEEQAKEEKDENINKDQLEKMMQKVKERMQKHQKEKEKANLQYSGGVDNDW